MTSDLRLRDISFVLAGVLVTVIATAVLTVPQLQAFAGEATAATACLALIILWLTKPRLAILASVGFQLAEGALRRILELNHSADGTDLIVVAAPVAVLVATLLSVATGRSSLRATAFSLSVAALIVFLPLGLVLSAPNVGEAAITATLLGAAACLPYWVARIGVTSVKSLLSLLRITTVLIALYGLFQFFVALPAWDQSWVDHSGYASLYIGNRIRSFASLASAQEYAYALVVGIVAHAASLHRRSLLTGVASTTILAIALFVSGSRGALLAAAIGVIVVLLVRTSKRPALALASVGLLSFAAPFALSLLARVSVRAGLSSDLASRQVNGLANPFDSSVSTGGLHLDLMLQAVRSAATSPLGRGWAAAMEIGDKNDISVMSIAGGILGLAIYGCLFAAVAASIGRLILKRVNDEVSAFSAAVVAALALQWVNASLYSTSFVIWVALGVIAVQASPPGGIRGKSNRIRAEQYQHVS